MKSRKRLLLFVMVLLFGACGWLHGYHNRKSNDNIPTKEQMVSHCLTQGENYAAHLLRGYRNTQLTEVWGDPDGCLFGMWGDIWETDTDHNLFVYYDSDGTVSLVKINIRMGQ